MAVGGGGGAAGLFVAVATLKIILGLLPAEAAVMMEAQLAAPTLLFSAALTLSTGLLFGLFPALHSTRPDLIASLKNLAGSRPAPAPRRVSACRWQPRRSRCR